MYLATLLLPVLTILIGVVICKAIAIQLHAQLWQQSVAAILPAAQ